MKKLIYCAAALATALFAGSCQQEMLDTPVGENTVTYTVEIPEVQTKAVIGDGLNVDQLIYEVWVTVNPNERDLNGFIEGTTTPKAVRLYQDETSLVQLDNKRKAVVTFNLVQDQNYTILFWAQVARGEGEAAIYDTENLTNVTYAGNVLPNSSVYFSNQEDYAAFYAAAFVKDSDSKSKSIKLKRPFAQLNIATENTVSHQSNSLYKVKINDSKVVLSNVATTFDVAQNLPEKTAVGGFSKFEFKTSDVPTTPSTLTVNGQTYEYVAMNYVFANGTTEVYYEIDATLTSEYAKKTEARVTNIVPNVPLKENYRTNIVGNLITSTTDYYVEIDANWADNGVGYVEEVWDGKNVMEPKKNAKGEYEIHLATELAWVAAAVNGTIVDPAVKSTGYDNPKTFANETFVLMADIDLANTVWVPIGALGSFDGTFDGNDHFIRNLNVNVDSIIEKLPSVDNKVAKTIPVGLFGRCKGLVKNLHVDGASVVGHYKAAVVVGDALCGMVESCDVKNATVTATPYDNNYGQHVGVIAGYLAADGAEAHVKNCAVAEVTVSSYRDVAAIVGTATHDGGFAPIVTGNIVENAVVIADQTPEYGETKAANAGYFVGRKSSNAVIENNEYINVDVKVIGGSDNDLKAAIANATEGDTVYFAGTYGTFPAVGKAITVVCEEGTVFQGTSSLNLNPESVVIGATFSNPSGNATGQTITGTFKNCTFTGSNGVRYAYAGEVCYFEDCVFDGSTYGVHFDGGTDKNIYFKNCVLSGFNAFAAAINLVTFDGCTFKANGKSGYNGANLWGSAKLINTNLVFDGSATYEWIDACSGDKEYEFQNCNINGGTIFNTTYITARNAGTKIKIDGVQYEWAEGGYFATEGKAVVTDAAALTAALATTASEITLALGTYEGTFKVGKNVKVTSLDAAKPATIKGRVNVVSANPTFENVYFDRNDTDSNAAWDPANGSSNCLQYRAVVMIYGDKTNKVSFNKCSFFNNRGSHKSAITNTAVELVIDECYFEGTSSSIYSQANVSLTNSTINYTGTNNVVLSINGCGENGGKVIFKNNKVTGENIYALGQFLSTVGFGNGKYYFDVQGNDEKFDNYFFNTTRVTNKEFAEGSLTF